MYNIVYMEDITALRKHSATIVCRYLCRVRDRNRATDLIQNYLSFRDSINDTTILGTPLSELPELYKYFRPGSSSLHVRDEQENYFSLGNCYTYDIRELIEMLRVKYKGAKCPYTNKPWTQYEKFHIVRAYYNRRSREDFQELIMDKPNYRQLGAVRSRLNFLMDPYDNFNIDMISDTHLFNLLTELMKYDVEDAKRSAHWIAQVHHHYINRNIDNYRICCYMFLIEMIEGANDPQITCLRVKARIEYCTELYPTTDPIEVHRVRFHDIESLLDFFDAPDAPDAPDAAPDGRQRSRSDSDSDSDRPQQRRRTSQSSEDTP
jgi:hypothetical protein